MGALYASRDPEEYGRARLSHVADTWKGKLDPAEYLNPGRHGEWTTASGAQPAHNPGVVPCAVVLLQYVCLLGSCQCVSHLCFCIEFHN